MKKRLLLLAAMLLPGCIIKLDDDADQRDIQVKVKADCDGPCVIDIDTTRSVNRVRAKKETKATP